MQIDWITVIAQIVNFLVLVWLLHRFLYGPVTRAMDRREQRIAHRLQEAERMREEADSAGLIYRQKQTELDQARERLVSEARAAARQERADLGRAAREEVERQKVEWLNQVDAQRQEFLRDLREGSQTRFFELARRALADLADASLENQIARRFGAKLTALDTQTKRKIADECARADGRILVLSRFELSPDQKRLITKTVHDNILDTATPVYEHGAATGGGIELKAGGQTLSWNIDGFLADFERQVSMDVTRMLPTTGAR